MTSNPTGSASMNIPPKRPLEERDEFEESPVKMREKCCWCGPIKRLVDKKHCDLCKVKGKECRRYHTPMPHDYYNLSSDYYRTCVEVKNRLLLEREKFVFDELVSRYEMEPNDNDSFFCSGYR